MEQTNTILEEIQKNISLIASQAGVLVGHLWVILTKQQVLYGLQKFLLGAFGVGIGIIFARMIGGLKKSRVAKLDKEFSIAILFICMLVLIQNIIL